MAEVFRDLEIALSTAGRQWRARACGRQNAHLLWEGWIEFEDHDGLVLRTERETTQPNREALEYWSAGLTPVYLEGALDRAARPAVLVIERARGAPAFEGPSEHPSTMPLPPTDGAILDPFSVFDRGERALRDQLGALGHRHLEKVARVHGLVSAESDLAAIAASDLVELIVAGVRSRVANGVMRRQI